MEQTVAQARVESVQGPGRGANMDQRVLPDHKQRQETSLTLPVPAGVPALQQVACVCVCVLPERCQDVHVAALLQFSRPHIDAGVVNVIAASRLFIFEQLGTL